MQDPNADTEWNDVLRAKGILPQKDVEITEDDLVGLVEDAIENKSNGKDLSEMGLDELDEIEDEIDEEEERLYEEYKRKRIAEMKEIQMKSNFGEVMEISKESYVKEVNQAGDGVWVVVHVYQQALPICKLLNNHLALLSAKFPMTKFLKSISSVCIPNYPDKNLPTIFVYHEGSLKKQWVGPLAFGGMSLTRDQLEWMLSQVGAVTTDLEAPPKEEIRDVMASAIRDSCITNKNEDSDDDY